jgi:acyl-CoA synthetase (AMP-forming)/AMP-acid ligase II
LAPGDRVAVFSENRPEWHIADFALLLSRLVVVPVYNTLSPSQIAYHFAAQRLPGSHYRRRNTMGNPAARATRIGGDGYRR